MDWQSTIGVAVPLSGDTDAIGESVARGAELAAAERQEDDEHSPSLRIEDTSGDPETAREVVEGMIDDGVPVIVGPISSDVGMAVRDLAERRGVPHLPAMCGNPDITRAGTRYTFRFSSSNRQSAEGTLRFFDSEGVDRVAVVAADFSYPHAVVRHMREYAPALDIEIGAVEHTPLGTEDFSEQIAAIDAEATDGIFLPYPGNNATTLIRQLHEAGLFEECLVVGDYSYGSAPYHRELGADILDTHNWAIDTIGEPSRRLSAALDEPAGVYHFFGYDVTRMASEALATVSAPNPDESPNPEDVRDAVAATEYDAASGWGVSFDEDGVNERYQMRINRWLDLGAERRNLPLFQSDPIVP